MKSTTLLAACIFMGLFAPAQTISTIAGNGTAGFAGDGGTATASMLQWLNNVMTTSFGDIYITDELNERGRKVKPDGLISTVAGNGISGFSGNGGPAIAASMNLPGGTLMLSSGDLLIADLLNH